MIIENKAKKEEICNEKGALLVLVPVVVEVVTVPVPVVAEVVTVPVPVVVEVGLVLVPVVVEVVMVFAPIVVEVASVVIADEVVIVVVGAGMYTEACTEKYTEVLPGVTHGATPNSPKTGIPDGGITAIWDESTFGGREELLRLQAAEHPPGRKQTVEKGMGLPCTVF